jgi:hypothetical protein
MQRKNLLAGFAVLIFVALNADILKAAPYCTGTSMSCRAYAVQQYIPPANSADVIYAVSQNAEDRAPAKSRVQTLPTPG